MASFFFTQQDSRHDEPAPRAGLKLIGGVTHQVAPKAQARASGEASVTSDSTWQSSLSQRKAEVAPPTLFSRARPQWKSWGIRFWQWLWDLDEIASVNEPLKGLDGVKAEFNTALWDLQSIKANQVRDLIAQAKSLRELWHLRADVFRVVSLHRGQTEAELRMESINTHFPIRASRRIEETRGAKVTTW